MGGRRREGLGKGVSVRKIDGFGSKNNGRMKNCLLVVPGSATRNSLKWTNEKNMLQFKARGEIVCCCFWVP